MLTTIKILGRIDNQVKVRGFRIEVGEVESVLESEPLVRKAVVCRFENPERLVAFVQVHQSGACAAGAEAVLFVTCRKTMPDYQVPAQFVEIDDFPYTSSGKVDRRRLNAPSIKRKAQSATAASSMTPMETVVAQVWAEVLDLPGVGPEDNFFALGGVSLTAIQMLRKLQTVLAETTDPGLQGRSFNDRREHYKVRLCLLYRKPRLKDYCAYLDWSALAAPNRSEADASNFLRQVGEDLPENALQGTTHAALAAEVNTFFSEEEDEADILSTALETAARRGRTDVADSLLRLGANPDGHAQRQLETNTPLAIAATLGHVDLARALLNAGTL